MTFPQNSAPHVTADTTGDGIVTAYRAKYRADHPEWSLYLQQQNPQQQAEKEGNDSQQWVPQPPEAGSGVVRIMRSAFICYEAEMVNNALWKEWPCSCWNGDDPLPRNTEQKVGCELVRAMVERGAWYLRSAADDAVGFVRDDQWNEMWGVAAGMIRGLLIAVDK